MNNSTNTLLSRADIGGEEHPLTFKIIKRRSPWNKEEDKAIADWVNKHGTGNWTIISSEMANLYGYKDRSGKQCRERWHNHWDPSVNKENWTEKEESILFAKHNDYGNKWSDIAKFLPGRTDNTIKNHFYSRLRKYIRKLLKQINKDNWIANYGIDPNHYTGEILYKIIKKSKVQYKNITKESIWALIINQEKNKNNWHSNNTKSPGDAIPNGGAMNKSGEDKNRNNTNWWNKKTKRRGSYSKGAFYNNLSKKKPVINKDKPAGKQSNNYEQRREMTVKAKRTPLPKKWTTISTKTKKHSKKRKKNSICLSPFQDKKTHIQQILLKSGRTSKQNYHNKISLSIETDQVKPINNKTINKSHQNNSSSYAPTPINENISDRLKNLKHLTLDSSFFSNNYYNQQQQQSPHFYNIPNDSEKIYSMYDGKPQWSPINITVPASTKNWFHLDLNCDHPSVKNSNNVNTVTNNTYFLTTPNSWERTWHNKIVIDESNSNSNNNNCKSSFYNMHSKEGEFERKPLRSNNCPIIDLGWVNCQTDNNTLFIDSINNKPEKNIILKTESNVHTTSNINNNSTTYISNMFNLSPVSAFIPKKSNVTL